MRRTASVRVRSNGSSMTIATRLPSRPIGTATLSFRKPRRKRALFVRVTRAVFYVDGRRVRTDRRAPFKQRFLFASHRPGSSHTLKARATIKLRRGGPRKKSISIGFQVCTS